MKENRGLRSLDRRQSNASAFARCRMRYLLDVFASAFKARTSDARPDHDAHAVGDDVVRERATRGANPLDFAFSLPWRQLSHRESGSGGGKRHPLRPSRSPINSTR
jgi:hypothetical protein